MMTAESDSCLDVAEQVSPARQRKCPQRWTEQEHELLLRIVEYHLSQSPVISWPLVAAEIGNRTGKQCRERWLNSRPENKQGGWQVDEEERLAQLHARHGPAWSTIVKFMVDRSENCIKNHWNSLVKCKTLNTRPETLLSIYILLIKEGLPGSNETLDKAINLLEARRAARHVGQRIPPLFVAIKQTAHGTASGVNDISYKHLQHRPQLQFLLKPHLPVQPQREPQQHWQGTGSGTQRRYGAVVTATIDSVSDAEFDVKGRQPTDATALPVTDAARHVASLVQTKPQQDCSRTLEEEEEEEEEATSAIPHVPFSLTTSSCPDPASCPNPTTPITLAQPLASVTADHPLSSPSLIGIPNMDVQACTTAIASHVSQSVMAAPNNKPYLESNSAFSTPTDHTPALAEAEHPPAHTHSINPGYEETARLPPAAAPARIATGRAPSRSETMLTVLDVSAHVTDCSCSPKTLPARIARIPSPASDGEVLVPHDGTDIMVAQCQALRQHVKVLEQQLEAAMTARDTSHAEGGGGGGRVMPRAFSSNAVDKVKMTSHRMSSEGGRIEEQLRGSGPGGSMKRLVRPYEQVVDGSSGVQGSLVTRTMSAFEAGNVSPTYMQHTAKRQVSWSRVNSYTGDGHLAPIHKTSFGAGHREPAEEQPQVLSTPVQMAEESRAAARQFEAWGGLQGQKPLAESCSPPLVPRSHVTLSHRFGLHQMAEQHAEELMPVTAAGGMGPWDANMLDGADGQMKEHGARTGLDTADPQAPDAACVPGTSHIGQRNTTDPSLHMTLQMWMDSRAQFGLKTGSSGPAGQHHAPSQRGSSSVAGDVRPTSATGVLLGLGRPLHNTPHAPGQHAQRPWSDHLQLSGPHLDLCSPHQSKASDWGDHMSKAAATRWAAQTLLTHREFASLVNQDMMGDQTMTFASEVQCLDTSSTVDELWHNLQH